MIRVANALRDSGLQTCRCLALQENEELLSKTRQLLSISNLEHSQMLKECRPPDGKYALKLGADLQQQQLQFGCGTQCTSMLQIPSCPVLGHVQRCRLPTVSRFRVLMLDVTMLHVSEESLRRPSCSVSFTRHIACCVGASSLKHRRCTHNSSSSSSTRLLCCTGLIAGMGCSRRSLQAAMQACLSRRMDNLRCVPCWQPVQSTRTAHQTCIPQFTRTLRLSRCAPVLMGTDACPSAHVILTCAEVIAFLQGGWR
jgi:hypothetical protein